MLHTAEKEYELRYDFNAYCDYEERFGRPLLMDMQKDGFAALRALTWAGLAGEYHMSLREVGKLLEDCTADGMTAAEIRLEIVRAMNESNFIRRLAERAAEKNMEQKTENEKAQESSSMS